MFFIQNTSKSQFRRHYYDISVESIDRVRHTTDLGHVDEDFSKRFEEALGAMQKAGSQFVQGVNANRTAIDIDLIMGVNKSELNQDETAPASSAGAAEEDSDHDNVEVNRFFAAMGNASTPVKSRSSASSMSRLSVSLVPKVEPVESPQKPESGAQPLDAPEGGWRAARSEAECAESVPAGRQSGT